MRAQETTKSPTTKATNDIAAEIGNRLLESVRAGRESCLIHDHPDLVPQAAADIVTYGFLGAAGGYHGNNRLSKDQILQNVRQFVREPERIECIRENLDATLSQLIEVGVIIEKRGSGGLFSLCTTTQSVHDSFKPWLRALNVTHDIYQTHLSSSKEEPVREQSSLHASQRHAKESSPVKQRRNPQHAVQQEPLAPKFREVANRLAVELNLLAIELLPLAKKFKMKTLDSEVRSEIKSSVGRFLSGIRQAEELTHEASKRNTKVPLWVKWQLLQYGSLVPDGWLSGNIPSDALTTQTLKKLGIYIDILPLPPTVRIARRNALQMLASALLVPPAFIALGLANDEVQSQKTFGTRANPKFIPRDNNLHPLQSFERYIAENVTPLTTPEILQRRKTANDCLERIEKKLQQIQGEDLLSSPNRQSRINEIQALVHAAFGPELVNFESEYLSGLKPRRSPLSNDKFNELISRYPTPNDFARALFKDATGDYPPDAGMYEHKRTLDRLEHREQYSQNEYMVNAIHILVAMGSDIARVEGASIIRLFNSYNPSEKTLITNQTASLLFARCGAATIADDEIRATVSSEVMRAALTKGIVGHLEDESSYLLVCRAFNALDTRSSSPAEAYRYVTEPGSDPRAFSESSPRFLRDVELISENTALIDRIETVRRKIETFVSKLKIQADRHDRIEYQFDIPVPGIPNGPISNYPTPSNVFDDAKLPGSIQGVSK